MWQGCSEYLGRDSPLCSGLGCLSVQLCQRVSVRRAFQTWGHQVPTSQPMNLWEQHIHRSSCTGHGLTTGMAAGIEVLLLDRLGKSQIKILYWSIHHLAHHILRMRRIFDSYLKFWIFERLVTIRQTTPHISYMYIHTRLQNKITNITWTNKLRKTNLRKTRRWCGPGKTSWHCSVF